MTRLNANEKLCKALWRCIVRRRDPPDVRSFAQRAAFEREGCRGILGKDVVVPDAPRGARPQGLSFPVDHVARLKKIQMMRRVRDLQVVLANVVPRCKAGEGAGVVQAIVAIGTIEIMSCNKYDTELLHQQKIVGGRGWNPLRGYALR